MTTEQKLEIIAQCVRQIQRILERIYNIIDYIKNSDDCETITNTYLNKDKQKCITLMQKYN